ncbi:MAG TPA: hypothetical protein ENF95_01200 [Candidatus Aenigmarchaeota archaeon]|nr:hypothetical protein [Candidatus Aenigmarchaeota archaeon]
MEGEWFSDHCADNVHNCDEYTYNGTECVPTVDCGTGGGALCAAHSVCGACCSGCNCVNLTIIDRKVSTKTKKENTINLKLKNENYLDIITVELYVKNENDLKTCFGKRCDPWEFYFWNGTGWYSPTALVTLNGGEGKILKFKFRASGPTPKGLYKIEIGIRNPGSPGPCPP